MKLTGHRTGSVYLRYDIADEPDLLIAAEKLDDGQGLGKETAFSASRPTCATS